MKSRNKFSLGIFYAFIAALFWGVSGTFVQYLVENKNIDISWLVTVRLLISGVILLSIGLLQKNGSINFFAILKNKTSRIQLLIFSIFGMVLVQYAYFAAIQYSNAATATVIQYTAPVLIAIYYALKNKKTPPFSEILAIGFAIMGIFLLVTHGDFTSLAISNQGLFWGILSAFSLAFYTVYPIELLKNHPPLLVIGWSMIIGGIGFSFITSPFDFVGTWDWMSGSMILFIIFIATALAFTVFLISVKWIGATMASLIATSEPLAATFLTVLWLQVAFELVDWLGCILILIAILILTLKKNQESSMTE